MPNVSFRRWWIKVFIIKFCKYFFDMTATVTKLGCDVQVKSIHGDFPLTI